MAMEEFRAAALPIPPLQYDQQYMQQLLRVLRIYFNQLDSDASCRAHTYRASEFIGGLHSGEGRGLVMPHVAASDSTNQYASADNTPTLVLWNTFEAGTGFTFNPSGYAIPEYDGVYKIDYSLQFVNTDNTAHDVFVWLQVNGGTPVANSTSRFTLQARKSPGDSTYLIAYSSVTFEVQAGDAIRLYWATEKAYSSVGPVNGIFMQALAAQTTPYVRPASPSAVGSITFLSAPA